MMEIGVRRRKNNLKTIQTKEKVNLIRHMAGRPSTVEKYIREKSQLSSQKKNVGFQD
jgi:hypothetical protein